MDILSFFTCFETLVGGRACRQLAIIAEALLAIPGRITMLSLSRWTEKGGSYRTLQRFFASRRPWSELLVRFFQTHLFDSTHEYLVAGDATTVTKAGSGTHGVDFFFGRFGAGRQKPGVFRLFGDRCEAAQSVSVSGAANSPQ